MNMLKPCRNSRGAGCQLIRTAALGLLFLACMGTIAGAENYVNWKGSFWFAIPEGWDKVDYETFDRYLSLTDTSREALDYEAVYAPVSSERFMEDAYLVITFDSTGPLTAHQTDSILNGIAGSYATEVRDAPVVAYMSKLVPGKPVIDRVKKAVSVVSEMAYRQGALRKLWLYMRLNDQGLMSFYFYSPDSTYEVNRIVFQGIVESLSFDNLRQAAAGQPANFTTVGTGNSGDAPSSSAGTCPLGITARILVVVVAVVVIAVFIFILVRRGARRSDRAAGER